jgi:hypothetical protein
MPVSDDCGSVGCDASYVFQMTDRGYMCSMPFYDSKMEDRPTSNKVGGGRGKVNEINTVEQDSN